MGIRGAGYLPAGDFFPGGFRALLRLRGQLEVSGFRLADELISSA